jgi:excisionase family DNA binding protein
MCGVTLLTKAEAAKRMTISIANLDRKVASGEIEATYLDRRIRFKLTEVLRFIDLRTGPSNRKRRRGLS